MLHPRLALTLCGLALSSAVACAALPGDESDDSEDAISVPGRWQLPGSVAAAGVKVKLHYDGAPAWSPSRCSGKLKSGAMRLGEFLQDQYPAITSVGGYACRRNTASSAKMSVHGTGRALDIFIPTIKGAADNSRGDPLANWLVANAERIGIQLVIWDRTVWQANGRGDKQYTGPVPHVDHLHVELTLDAAAQKTPWFLERDAAGLDLDDAEAPDPNDADAGPDEDPEIEDPPTDDAGATPPDADASTPAPADAGAAQPAEEAEPPIEEEPAEGESTGTATRNAAPPSSSVGSRTGDGSSGCSAAPGTTTGFAFPLALVLAACVVRRRRRS